MSHSCSHTIQSFLNMYIQQLECFKNFLEISPQFPRAKSFFPDFIEVSLLSAVISFCSIIGVNFEIIFLRIKPSFVDISLGYWHFFIQQIRELPIIMLRRKSKYKQTHQGVKTWTEHTALHYENLKGRRITFVPR